VTFLGVNIWDKEEESRKFVAERGVSYPVGHDTGDRVAKIYGVQGTPTTVFVGRDGRVAAIVQGTMELESLTALLERLVQGP
jgi:cytochrome c biogenesis protein CcmG, thiol:disulfide interchange protein DsbE